MDPQTDASWNPRTLVALATYNERENLPSLIEAIEAALPLADVLVVDDNSPDGTGAWCDKHADGDPRLAVLHRAGKLGLGSATLAAFSYAAQHAYDVVCTMDADWSHPPERLPVLVASLAGADVAVGSRYAAGGGIDGWPLRRRVSSWLLNFFAVRALRLPVKDCSGAFRAYRMRTLQGLEEHPLQATGYAYLEEILWRLKRRGARIVESPFTFTDRRAGASKLNVREALAAVGLLLRLGSAEWLGVGRGRL
ncbi:Undecaprenyl-phosphate mannosyltransferase [Pirellulimonas nuda]|uniref:Undecaprenyl-phosphate mannosyltransferase n=2 Tax=Pirellulimonas nuda TaxID=2528009 RepID=A0A518DI36_9BACT|nr:Undecaprenyl-phosphate mannosyltransferase [Pirellulimonas nuda]